MANPSVIYTSTGNHTVQLIASGPGGADTTEQTISVQFNPLPVASFTINADTADAPFVALFTNTSQEAENFFWDFGDYSNSIDANPYHLYQNPGDYLVSLIAGNSCGNDTSFVLVHVTIGTGIFKSENPVAFASAIVKTVVQFDNPTAILEASMGLSAPMPGIEMKSIPIEQRLADRGW